MQPIPSSPEMSAPPIRGQRSYLKCTECRCKKRKCEPEDRDWDGRREKCRNCAASGLSCGPNVPFNHPRTPQPNFSPPSIANPVSFATSSGAPHHQGPSPFENVFDRGSVPRGFASSPTEHKKARSFSVFETGSETRLPSARDTIRARLIDLGNLCDLYRYLQGRQDAVVQAQPPRPNQEYKDIYDLVTTVLDYARKTYAHNCDHIMNALPHASKADKELFLRTLVEKISHFLSVSLAVQQVGNVSDGDDYFEIKVTHCRGLCQLATICDEAGDYSDAYRFRCQLETLAQHYNVGDIDAEPIHASMAFTNMSDRVSKAFRSLKIPTRFARLLPPAENMFPAFHLAMHAGQPVTAHNILIDGICNAEERDIISRQALHIAAEMGDLCLLQLALQERADAQSDVDVFQMTALCIATYMGNCDLVKRLVESGSNDTATEMTGRTILCIAAGRGHLTVVDYLLHCGCRPNVANQFGPSSSYSALHAAAAGGHPQIVESLLLHGASALFLSNGLTPAEEALAHGHRALAERLSHVETEQKTAFPDQLETSERAMHRAFLTNINPDHLLPHITSSPSSFVPQPIAPELDNTMRSASLSLSTSESSHPSPLFLSASVSGSPSGRNRPRKRPRPSSCHPTSGRGSPSLSDLSSRASSSSRAKAKASLGEPSSVA